MIMKNKLSRIDSFVESLRQSELTDSQETVVLTGSLEKIGGHNDGNCVNKNENDCSGTNRGCTNHGVCLKGLNIDCRNEKEEAEENPVPKP